MVAIRFSLSTIYNESTLSTQFVVGICEYIRSLLFLVQGSYEALHIPQLHGFS